MSKLEDAITKAKGAALKSESYGYDHVTLSLAALQTLIDWIEETRSKNEYLFGERVKLALLDPEDDSEPETGRIIGFADGGGFLIRPDTGEYSDTETGLWYARGNVSKMED